ncbi:MAG: thioredoxin domain-containing protein [Myxococcota bacterium]
MAERPRGPGRGALIALCSLAAASGLWGLFLWVELLNARQGGEVFCPLGDGLACATLWDSSFASAVHAGTGVPIAGWGLVWSLVAFAVPAGLLRERKSRLLVGSLVATAAAGALGVITLLAVSASLGSLCGSCLVTYVLVSAFAVVVLWTTRGLAPGELARGGAGAALLAGLGFVLVLYPGLLTPLEPAALARLPELQAEGGEPAGLDVQLASFVARLSVEESRGFGEELRAYAAATPSLRPARHLHGSVSAPVRLTDFTDTLCGHCARFHGVIEALQQAVPASAFSVEERHFPLDAACNPSGPTRGPGVSVRCRAALARICLEDTPHAFEYSGDLFRHQEELTAERVLSLAEPYTDLEGLQRCMDSTETRAKLREDIEWALEQKIRGTPLVLVNGRRAPASGGFVYALILAGGRPDHPAFASLTPAAEGDQ